MTVYYTFDKMPTVLGRTALGLEFNMEGVASAITLYWLKERRSLANALLSEGKYVYRIATDARTIYFGQAPMNDPVIIRNAFPNSPDSPDLTLIVTGPLTGGHPTPEMFEKREAKISLVAGRF